MSHLLFLYSEHLDAAAHVGSAFELLRVAEEVRIFPLVTLGRRWSPHVETVRTALEAAGCTVEIVTTSYEFQRAEDHAGNRMMRIRRRGSKGVDPAGRSRASDPAGNPHGGEA